MINELDLLKGIWQSAPRFKRIRTLIVPSVCYDNNQGSLNNDHWAYRVPYAFRDALDIHFDTLRQTTFVIDDKGEKQSVTQYYQAWTQGCLLGFSAGDFFESTTDKPNLQIASAKPMMWNTELGVMDEGEVVYEEFVKRGLCEFFTLSQMDFLQLLIGGRDDIQQ